MCRILASVLLVSISLATIVAAGCGGGSDPNPAIKGTPPPPLQKKDVEGGPKPGGA